MEEKILRFIASRSECTVKLVLDDCEILLSNSKVPKSEIRDVLSDLYSKGLVSVDAHDTSKLLSSLTLTYLGFQTLFLYDEMLEARRISRISCYAAVASAVAALGSLTVAIFSFLHTLYPI